MNLHQRGVGLRVQHGLTRPVALNLKNANGCLCCLALQIEGFFQLRQCGLGFVEVFPRLFCVDAREQFDLLHL